MFGCKKLELLRRFRPFANDAPAHHHLGDILSMLAPEQFRRCFVARVAALRGHSEGFVAIDGKIVRQSGQKRKGQVPIRLVSVFAGALRLLSGKVKAAEKSNEITAIRKLLDPLAIEGAIVTIDAVGCQREIAQKIVDEKPAGFKDGAISRTETVDADHGHIETRTTASIHDVDWLPKRHNWPGLNAVVIVDSSRDTGDKQERETRFYITSLLLTASILAPIVRSDWRSRMASTGCRMSASMRIAPENARTTGRRSSRYCGNWRSTF